MEKDLEDVVGKPLSPRELQNFLHPFITLEDVVREAKATVTHAQEIINLLCALSYLKPKLGMECPYCGFTWVVQDPEDAIPQTIECVSCKKNLCTTSTPFRMLYKIQKSN